MELMSRIRLHRVNGPFPPFRHKLAKVALRDAKTPGGRGASVAIAPPAQSKKEAYGSDFNCACLQ
jgi:hypothetical protein